jgi:hypothetical protein
MDGLQGTWGKYDFENLDFGVESEFFAMVSLGMLYAVGWRLAVCWQGKVLKHKARPSLKEVFGE